MSDTPQDKAPLSPGIVGSAGFVVACAVLPYVFGILHETGVITARPGDIGAELAFWIIAVLCGVIPFLIQQERWHRWERRQ